VRDSVGVRKRPYSEAKNHHTLVILIDFGSFVVVMSFLRPDAIAKFNSLESFLLWFQMAYSIWQFVRTAKFFRLPYVTVSSSWHGFDSWYKTRKLILMRDDLDVDKDALPDKEDALLPKTP
jgi:hypothetical protein